MLVSEFFLTIIRSYINIASQLQTKADDLILTPPTQVIFENSLQVNLNNSKNYLNELFQIEKMPDLKTYCENSKIEIADVFELRKKSRNLRKFINETEYVSTIDFYKEYRDQLDSQYKFLDNKFYKIIKLAATNLVSPIGWTWGTVDLLGGSDKIKEKVFPTVRLQDIYKDKF